MIKYVTYGTKNGPKMYMVRLRKELHSYMVEVLPCDIFGTPVSDATFWDLFPCWLDAFCCFRKQYREFSKYVNRS